MKKLLFILPIAILFFVLSAFQGPNDKIVEKEEIEWVTFMEAVELSKANPKKVFVDVYTDWCGPCKLMDRNTFTNPEVVKYINENYYAVKLNGESKETFSLNGTEYKFVASGRRGYNELAAALASSDRGLLYPTLVFLDVQFSKITAVPGYKTPQQLYPILSFISDEEYKDISYEAYTKSKYNSPFGTAQ